jgi:hypothetical protein
MQFCARDRARSNLALTPLPVCVIIRRQSIVVFHQDVAQLAMRNPPAPIEPTPSPIRLEIEGTNRVRIQFVGTVSLLS